MRTKIRDFALALPEAREALPWGERVVKVKNKVFVFLGQDMTPDRFGFSVKLPSSKERALSLPFCSPTGYGLGKSGWVSGKLESASQLSFTELRNWVLESYAAVAPKTLAARVAAPAAKLTAKKKAAPKVKMPAEASAGKVKSSARGPRATKKAPKR